MRCNSDGMKRAKTAYMRDVDHTLLRENLKLTAAERLEKLVRFSSFATEFRQAGQKARTAPGRARAR